MKPLPKLASSADRRTSTPAARDVGLTHRPTNTVKSTLPRTRKSGAKTRTGCLTCKVRRVKCDEARPHCNRCIKAGVKCDGYAAPSKHVPKGGKVHVILPKQNVAFIPAATVTSPITRMRNGAGFQNESDGGCFRLYLEETSRQIQGIFPSTLWGRLIPQISEMEPFVRDAIIAIGALSKSSKFGNRHQLPGTGPQELDFQYALKQYDRSLRGMREAISLGQQDLRKALIACLLVFCFEGMLGNQAAAAIHAERGLMLLHQWTTGKNPFGTPWQTQKSWADHHFEEDLLDAFNALDLQVLLFIDTRGQAVHQHMKTALNRIIDTMPPEFTSLAQAKQFWQLIMNRNYHFGKSFQAIDIPVLKEERLDTPWEGSANFLPGELLLSDSKEGHWTLQQEHMRYRNDIYRWTLASAALFDKVIAGPNEHDRVAAAVLQVQTKVSHIMLAGTFLTSEIAYDAFLPEFTAITTLAEIILPHILSSYEGSAPRFHFDIGIVAGLFLVGSRCRDDVVRQRAIELLFAANYREGIWDALAVAHIARWLRSLEVEGAEEGDFVPEEKRAVLSMVNIDLYHRRAALGASQRTKEGVVDRKTVLVW